MALCNRELNARNDDDDDILLLPFSEMSLVGLALDVVD